MLTPDMSKRVFLDIFFKDEKKTKEISDKARSTQMAIYPFMICILAPCFYFFFVGPFIDKKRLGDNTAYITVAAFIVGYVCLSKRLF